jgi:DNA-binding transcriptional LysR family regulator
VSWEDRIGRRLRLKDLHTLQVIAERGSMAKASAELGLSQPAISKAVADMEHVLGAALLDRSARGVELTEAGRLLVGRGRVAFDELRQGVQDIQQFADPTRGEVRIGTTEPISAFVAEVIIRLHRLHPGVTYQVAISDTTTLIRQLRERELDVVITRWTDEAVAEDIEAEALFSAPLAVLADRSHPLAPRKGLTLADLAGEAWTLSPQASFLGRIVADLFERAGLAYPVTVVTTLSIHMRLNLLASGAFLTVLPARMAGDRANAGWLRAVDVALPESAGTIAAITVRNRRSGGATSLFQQACRDVAALG